VSERRCSYLPRPTEIGLGICILLQAEGETPRASDDAAKGAAHTRPASLLPSVSLQCSVTTDSPAIEQPVVHRFTGRSSKCGPSKPFVSGEEANGTRQDKTRLRFNREVRSR
jgi:hypothetical protein